MSTQVSKPICLFNSIVVHFFSCLVLFSSCNVGTDSIPEPVVAGADSTSQTDSESSPEELETMPDDADYQKAETFAEQNLLDSALVYMEKSSLRYDREAEWSQFIHTHKKKAEYSWRMADYRRARNYLETTLEVSIEHTGDHNLEVAILYNNLGNVADYSGDYDSALEYHHKALGIRKELLDPYHPDLASTYNNLGIVYRIIGDYERSLANHNESLRIKQKSLGEKDPKVGNSYHNMGVVFDELGDYDLALEYLKQGEDIWSDTLGAQHPYVAFSYNSIGLVHNNKGDYDLALEAHLQALSIWQGHKEYRDEAITYHSLGQVYHNMQQYEDAIFHFNEAKELFETYLGRIHPDMASTHHNLGLTYRDLGKMDVAISHFQEALTIRDSVFGDYHPDIAASYIAIATVYEMDDELETSLDNILYSLQSNRIDFADSGVLTENEFKEPLSEKRLLESLEQKSKLHTKRWLSTGQVSDLRIAHQINKISGNLTDQMRHSYKAEGSKLFLAKQANRIFDHGIQTAQYLFHQTDSVAYLDDAFKYAEKSKVGVLLDAISEAEAKTFSSVPDSLEVLERDLRISLAGYENLIAQEHQKGTGRDSTLLANWQNKVFDLNRDYERLIDHFESNYPDYYTLKYSTSTASVEQVQDFLRQEQNADATLVSYSLGTDSLYSFVITPTAFSVTATARDDSLETLVNQLREGVMDQLHAQYQGAASKLYSQLIAPIEAQFEGNQLIIIPDGVLSYVPFEVLLSSPEEEAYQDLPYLLRDYAISYAYSATLLLQTQQRRSQLASRDLLAFAPVFSEGLNSSVHSESFTEPAVEVDSSWSMRYGEGALPFTREEVLLVEELFQNQYGFFDRFFGRRTEVYLENEAREAYLKSKEAEEYRYIHLATHGYTSAQVPQLSRLLFMPDVGEVGEEDGVLHLSEVYTLNLNADLVVLSACETGLGQLAEGEGLIGLTRAFTYAGARELVVSLWSVPDHSSKELMVRFYEHLLGGSSEAEALRQAKLDMIDRDAGPPYVPDPLKWAGFIHIGA